MDTAGEFPLSDPGAAYTISAITSRIKIALEDGFDDVWVRGEISNLKQAASGHVYFSLKDAAAQIAAVMFRSHSVASRGSPSDSSAAGLVPGGEILAHGRISVYGTRGSYQLIVDFFKPLGAGALQLAFEELKARLAARGWFDEQRKRKLPPVPRRIGIVTSPSGAAINDIIKVTYRRYPNMQLILFPASVQGDKAPAEIATAIACANKHFGATAGIADRIDLLIVGRGGGSLEDLWAFNTEIVAQAIHDSQLPVISAVGHEIDFTISDFVADLRAPTPSAAAEIAVPDRRELTERLQVFEARIGRLIQEKLKIFRLRLEVFKNKLIDPRQRLLDLGQRLDELGERLLPAISSALRARYERLVSLAGLLNSFNPLNILERGFTVTTNNKGRLLKSVKQVKHNEMLNLRFHDGSIICRALLPAGGAADQPHLF